MNDDYAVYNVIASVEILDKMLFKFRGLAIEEKFSSKDWNVKVPNEEVNNFVNWCDGLGVEYSLV